MKKQKVVVMVLAIWMVFAGTTAVQAQMGGPGPGLLRDLMTLDLTDAQKTQILGTLTATETERETARQKHEAARDVMSPVLEADTFNEENFRTAFQASSTLMEDAMAIEVKIRTQIRAVLTEAQKQTLAERREKGMGGMENRAEFEEALLKTWLQTTSE